MKHSDLKLTSIEIMRNNNPEFALLAKEGRSYLGQSLASIDYIQSELHRISNDMMLVADKNRPEFKNMMSDMNILIQRIHLAFNTPIS